MNLLLTTDTHLMFHFTMRLAEIEGINAIIHAGDHLEFTAFGQFPEANQIQAAKYAFQETAKRRLLITCSGNHDVEGKDKHWVEEFNYPNYSGGNSHTLIATAGSKNVVITSFPYNHPRWLELAEDGKNKADKLDARWIVVHHDPPKDSKTAGGKGGNLIARRIILQFSPEIFICGHKHNAPYTKNGSWNDKMRDTLVINPGRKDMQHPNYVLLNLSNTEPAIKWKTNEGFGRAY